MTYKFGDMPSTGRTSENFNLYLSGDEGEGKISIYFNRFIRWEDGSKKSVTELKFVHDYVDGGPKGANISEYSISKRGDEDPIFRGNLDNFKKLVKKMDMDEISIKCSPVNAGILNLIYTEEKRRGKQNRNQFK